MEKQIQALQEILDRGKRIVFFTGAGASTESGIPDFRSVDGLYQQQYDYPPEEIISHHFFESDPKEFYRFYRSRMLYPNARPNAAHRFMAELEKTGQSAYPRRQSTRRGAAWFDHAELLRKLSS